MADENSKIQNDQYGLLKDFQNFTGQYFGLGSGNSSEEVPENSKLGLFGYMNEIVAHATKISMYHRNALYNEIALNTASIPETIYSAAADEGVDATEAVPAKATITLVFGASELLNLINSTPSGLLKLDRESFVVNMDSVYFHLPFSVYIRTAGEGVIAFYNSHAFSYRSAHYDAEPMLLSNSKEYLTNSYIESTEIPDTESDDGKRYIILKIDVFQYEVSNETHDLASSNLANSINFQVDLEDQLAGFTVFYKEEDSEYAPIEKYQSRSLVVSEDPYCSYNFIDENSFQILFDLTSSGWRPANGSSALVKSCTTTGSNGNFNFVGDLYIEDPNVNLEMTGSIILHPAGGKDRPSIQELKQAVYEKRQKVEVLSTEEDLNTYFAKLSNSVFNGISKVVFRRDTDTIIKRLFMGYLLLGDSKGRPFPTNTALEFDLNNVTSGLITASDPIIPDYETDPETGKIIESLTKFRFLDDEENLDELIKNNHHVYFSPFVIQCFNGECWRYFDLTINELKTPIFKEVNTDSDSNPILNYLKIRRSITATSISEELSINEANKLDDTHIFLELATNFISDISHKKTFLVILSNENIAGNKLGILFEPPMSENPAKSNLCIMRAADHFIQNEGEMPTMEIVNACSDSGDQKFWMFNMDTGEIFATEPGTGATVRLESKVHAKIYILEDYSNLSSSPYGNLNDEKYKADLSKCVSAVEEDSYVYEEASVYFDPEVYRIKAVAEVSEPIEMFRSMDDVFAATFSDASNCLGGVPLVGAEVAFNDKYYEEFIQEYKSYLNALKDSIYKLVNNTGISIKFFNSYGPSNRLQIRTTTLEEEEEELEVVPSSDLEVWLDLERENGQDDEVEAQIKKITEDFFRDINTLASNNMIINGKVSVTKLTTAIERAVPSVSAANVIQINGIKDPRFIVINANAYKEYPEYTNIGLPINPDEQEFPESVRIVFHYTF
jgi:hypothetical protein